MRLTRTTRYSLLVVALVAIGWWLIWLWLQHILPANAITLQTNQHTYTAGDKIVLTITNNTAKTLYIENNCPSEPLTVRHQDSDDQWREREVTVNKNCGDDQSIALDPGTAQQIDYSPWQAELFKEPGKYRVELEVEGYETHYFTEFTIQ